MPLNQIKYFQKGFNFSQDGPGNRLVYHLYGCNFRCPWCANPECFAPDTATTTVTVDEMLAEILRSRPMFFSGGGVTFTGGEPTLQFEALLELLHKLKEENVHTAIECNASHPRLRELLPYVDHLMMDLKHTIPNAHQRIMEAELQTVTDNIRLAASTRQLALRIPLVNGYNTDKDCIEGFCKFLAGLPQNPALTVELIPYHEYGKIKWQQHGMEYTVQNGFLAPARLAEIRAAFLEAGIPTIQT